MIIRSFRSRTIAAALIIVGFLGATGCGGDDNAKSDAGTVGQGVVSWTRVGPQELAEMLENKDFTMVNVHVPYEGEIRSTDAFIPYDRILDRLGELPEKDSQLVLYCKSGRMSTIAAQQLSDRGYTDVYELDGGFDAWRTAGRELDPSRS